MKKFLLSVLIISPLMVFSQVGIGTNIPESSAKLEVSATDKGFLPPRVTLTGTADISTIASPATGLFVYNTATAGVSPSNVTPGLYYYDGSKWQRIINQQPDATVEFNQPTPTTAGVEFTPNITASKDYVYVSTTDNSQWTYNGSTYVTYTSPASTAWNLAGGTADAGSNKTGGIVRSGKVGIGSGITTPSNIVEINGTGGTGTGLKLTTGAGVNKVLSSDANGNASWVTNVAITSAINATLSTSVGTTIGQNTNTETTITLPPGKWSVQITMLAFTASVGSYWLRTGLSTSNSSFTNTYTVGASLVSGLVQGSSKYNMLTGTLIINNTSGSNLTFYYWTQAFNSYDGGITSATFDSFGKSAWGENSIVAYPMN